MRRDPSRHPENARADRVEGNWRQLKGYLREKWGNLTDDELDRLEGRREQLLGYLQERTARERMELEKDIEDLSRRANYAW